MARKKNIITILQLLIVGGFITMACASASSGNSSSSRGYYEVGRSALVGGMAGSEGKVLIGTADSEEGARRLTASKGYTQYTWDSRTGGVYAK